MQTIAVTNLVQSGVHGLTDKESRYSQRFEITVSVHAPKPTKADDIETAVDYRVMRKVTQEVINGERCLLMETLSEKIASRVLDLLPVESVTVEIKKLDIWPAATPIVKITRHRLPSRLNLHDFEIDEVIASLSETGAVSLPIMNEERRVKLLKEAQGYSYEEQPEFHASGVQEQLSSFQALPPESLFCRLRDDFNELLLRKLRSSDALNIFSFPLHFTELSIQKYPAGSVGITPHRDGRSFVNLICVFMIGGQAEFALCDDRSGHNPTHLDTTPGNVIILRAPGFYASDFQPFHFVNNVTEERYVFGLRQKRPL